MTNPKNRRDFRRTPFRVAARLTDAAGTWEGKLCDISLKGALMEMPADWCGAQGSTCRIAVDLAPEVTITMDATVAHLDGNHVGLRCDNIDIDSITHLRRLMELNAVEPGSLDRELAALLRTN